MLKPGWLDRQFEKARKDIENWPNWMREAAGLGRKPEKEKPNTRENNCFRSQAHESNNAICQTCKDAFCLSCNPDGCSHCLRVFPDMVHHWKRAIY